MVLILAETINVRDAISYCHTTFKISQKILLLTTGVLYWCIGVCKISGHTNSYIAMYWCIGARYLMQVADQVLVVGDTCFGYEPSTKLLYF